METQFNFFQQWYPLSPIEDLDSKRPTAVAVLGIRLVIWKPKSAETFCVFIDQCPHRLAPLSEGRIDDTTGDLMCSYHGWQFDSQGSCTQIPQAENPNLVTQNKGNLCVIALPVQQQQDLLWVWLDAASSEQAMQTPLPLSPQVDASKGFVWSSFVRDLAYDWQTLVENVTDPSHVPFAHHGVQGDRNKATAMPIKIVQSTPSLIEATVTGRLPATITFEPPCRLEYAIQFGDGSKTVGLVTYCVPVSPGKSRIVAQFPRNFAKTLYRLTPRWWEHVSVRNRVLDGDMILLQQQEQFLQQRSLTESWKTAYKLPTSADRLVIEFRNWFDRYCQGRLPWVEKEQSLPAINDNREQALDRYKQHTQHCSSCRAALLVINRIQISLLLFFAISVAIAALLPDVLRVKLGLPLILFALLGLSVYGWLKLWLSPKFYFVDYIHAYK